MEASPGPARGVGRFARYRLPLLLAAIVVVAVPAGYAVAEATRSAEPSGSPVDWSQADWIAYDPALDPAAWKDAKLVPMDCPKTATDSECWRAEGWPKLNHDAPVPWPRRELECEVWPTASESAKDPLCRAQVIPEGYPPNAKAELEAYGVDRAFGGAAKR
jgi:hypothetical protein